MEYVDLDLQLPIKLNDQVVHIYASVAKMVQLCTRSHVKPQVQFTSSTLPVEPQQVSNAAATCKTSFTLQAP